jgi:hypothetical protein
MKRLGASAVLLLGAVSTGVVFARHCPGCIERSRVNKACEWTGDVAFPIDWNNSAHRQHLVADAQLAEDLAIRHADAEFNRLYGYEAHGGLIDSGRVVRECMAQLVGAIEANHAVTLERIAVARGERSRLFDTAAAVSFLPLFALAAIATGSRLSRRFSAEKRSVRLVAITLASAIAGFLGLQAGQLWGAVWEAVRVRNGHMSPFRSAIYTRWTNHHFGAIFMALAVTFCLVAICWRSPAFRKLTRNATMFAGAMLIAMFADVFVQNAIGYVLMVAVLVLFCGFVWSVDRLPIREPESSGRLLFEPVGIEREGPLRNVGAN